MAKEKNHKGKQSHNRKAKIFRNWGVSTWEEIKEKLDEEQKPAQRSNDKKKL